eukprot:1409970-Amphidinium_carterae.1
MNCQERFTKPLSCNARQKLKSEGKCGKKTAKSDQELEMAIQKCASITQLKSKPQQGVIVTGIVRQV